MYPVRGGEVEVHRLDGRAQPVVPARPGAVVVGRQAEGRVEAGAQRKARGGRISGEYVGHEPRLSRLTPAAADGSSEYRARAVHARLEARVDVVAADDELHSLEAGYPRGDVPDGARVFGDGGAAGKGVADARGAVLCDLEKRRRSREGHGGKRSEQSATVPHARFNAYRPSISRARRPAERSASSASTTSRPSRLASAAISASKVLGPSASAASIESKRLPSRRGGSGVVDSIPRASPTGSVRSKPALAPVFALDSDGSSGSVRNPDCTTRSRSAWKRVASAQSICSSEKISMSGSTTNTCFTLARQPNAAAMALRASPGTRWRIAMRRLYIPPLAGVAYTAWVSRTAVSKARQTMTSVRSAFSCAVSVRPRFLPPIVAVLKSASRRRVTAVRWNTGFCFTPP